jgi:serine/threonine-protein kinase
MDSDLEAVARGGHVPVETAEAATMVLGGAGIDGDTAVTQVARRPRPVAGYPTDFDPMRRRRRPIWPWLAGAGALLALLVGGFLLYDNISDAVEGAAPANVPYVVGLQQAQAVTLITEEGLVPRVRPAANSDVEEGTVFGQNPTEGTRVEDGTSVVIEVSTGKPQVTIPSVVGQSRDSAVAELTDVGLDAQVKEVNSDRAAGTVTAQDPEAGTLVVEGTRVRINVSAGPRPISVPSVVNLPYDQARAELQGAGFGVSRVDVASDLAKGIVVDQDPSGGTESSRGTTVTLSVSRGPSTVAVPDVTFQDATVAQATLENAGFRVRQVVEQTDDPSLDGIVTAQEPVGSTQAEPNSLVTIYVGSFQGETTDTTDTTTTP